MMPSSQRLSNADAVALGGQIADLARAGLPLGPGLRAASLELRPGRLARALDEAADRLEAGSPLDSVLAGLEGRLPDHVRGLILAGVRTGALDRVLEQFIDQERRSAALRRQVRLALAYPVLLLALVAAVIVFFGIFVVGAMVSLAQDLELQLPLQTELLIAIGRIHWLWPLAVIAGLICAACMARSMAPIWTHKMLCRLPLIGPVRRFTALSELCRMLALLVEQRVPMPEALTLTAGALRDAHFADAVRWAAARTAEGEALSCALAELPPVPATLAPLVAWGEATSTVGESLLSAAELFESQATAQVNLLRMLLPPLMFLLVVGAIGFLIVASFMPLIKMIETLT